MYPEVRDRTSCEVGVHCSRRHTKLRVVELAELGRRLYQLGALLSDEIDSFRKQIKPLSLLEINRPSVLKLLSQGVGAKTLVLGRECFGPVNEAVRLYRWLLNRLLCSCVCFVSSPFSSLPCLPGLGSPLRRVRVEAP